MLIFFSAKYYVIIFLILAFISPLIIFFPIIIFGDIFFSDLLPCLIFYLGFFILNIIGMVFTFRYNSSSRLSFFKGLEIITSANMSGCGNLTAIYIYPFLFTVYCMAVFNAIMGLFKGKVYTEKKWLDEVSNHETIHRFRYR